MYSKIRLAGHPIHPMLIAYPVALYTATVVGYIVFGATASTFWLKFAIACNIGGFIMALVASLPGLGDWMLAIPEDSPAKKTGAIHAALNGVALVCFGVTAGIYFDDFFVYGGTGAMPGIIIGAVGILFTVAAGFQGWKLVQDHHVGVKLLPEQERIEMATIHTMRRAG